MVGGEPALPHVRYLVILSSARSFVKSRALGNTDEHDVVFLRS